MSLQVIPVNSAPGQTFNVSVSINGAVYSFFVLLVFNEVAMYWVMSISDANQNLIVAGVPLVTGLNVLRQFQYLGIGSIYVINATGVDIDFPNSSDLGSDFLLCWADNTQVAA
jgi:hypothetical protein